MKKELESRGVEVVGAGPDHSLSNLSANLESVKLDSGVTHVLFGFDQHFSHTKGTSGLNTNSFKK